MKNHFWPLALVCCLFLSTIGCFNSSPPRVADLAGLPRSYEKGSPVLGPDYADVTMVVFSDFQCSFCQDGLRTQRMLLEKYPERIRLVFKHYPVRRHPQSVPAAKAALAAGEQGKFWEMHDALFENQNQLSESLYPELALSLGLNVERFNEDRRLALYDRIIRQDLALATSYGVQGTPTYFINGVPVRGAQPFADFKQIVERQIQGSGISYPQLGKSDLGDISSR